MIDSNEFAKVVSGFDRTFQPKLIAALLLHSPGSMARTRACRQARSRVAAPRPHYRPPPRPSPATRPTRRASAARRWRSRPTAPLPNSSSWPARPTRRPLPPTLARARRSPAVTTWARRAAPSTPAPARPDNAATCFPESASQVTRTATCRAQVRSLLIDYKVLLVRIGNSVSGFHSRLCVCICSYV